MSEELPSDGSGAMFDSIADRYDRLNRVLSLGIDRRWRRLAIASLGLGADASVADVAAGTGDMTLEILRQREDAQVIDIDPAPRMLDVARGKLAHAGYASRVRLEVGRAESLPLRDGEVDGTCIAFGIRNVPDRMAGLREMARVTKKGGRVVVLELGQPRGGLLSMAARFYVRGVVPWVGALLSRKSAYRYLERSIAAFPPPKEFAGMMAEAGLRVVEVRPLTFGVCHLFVGEVP